MYAQDLDIRELQTNHWASTQMNFDNEEVVCVEVLESLNAEIIYAILNSSWVSPIQVVHKKEGMNIVKNDENELISMRTITS